MTARSATRPGLWRACQIMNRHQRKVAHAPGKLGWVTVPAGSRLRAADSVLDHAARAIEIDDLDARISDLERAAEKPTLEIE